MQLGVRMKKIRMFTQNLGNLTLTRGSRTLMEDDSGTGENIKMEHKSFPLCVLVEVGTKVSCFTIS